MNSITIRHLSPNDSLEALMGMLHRAFEPLGRRALNCTCVDQTVDVTRQRVALGDCFVALVDGQIVGTITLHGPDRASPVLRYREPTVASIHQFAVEPGHQGRGVGQALLHTAERWARSRRCRELALDTPQPAVQLRAYYRRRGFSLVETVHFDGKSYLSVVLSKSIVLPSTRTQADHWPLRRPAEAAALALASDAHRRRRHHAAPAAGRQGSESLSLRRADELQTWMPR